MNENNMGMIDINVPKTLQTTGNGVAAYLPVRSPASVTSISKLFNN